MSAINISNLKESNEFLNAIFDNINSAVMVVDDQVQVRKVNDSFEKLFVADEEMVNGKLCGNAIGCSYTVDEDESCGNTSYCSSCTLRSSIVKALTKKETTYKEIITRDFQIGEKRVHKEFQFTTNFIEIEGKRMIVIVVDDLTEILRQQELLEKQNEELSRLNRQKNEFLGMAAHDIRNPIGGIQSLSDLLLNAMVEISEQEKKEMYKLIYDSSKFSLELLNDLLDVNKLETGIVELEHSTVDYQDFLQNVIDRNRIYANNKNIKISTDIPESRMILNIDKIKIEQVLNNFISNAIKFSYPETKITLKVDLLENRIVTSLVDEGQGIPVEEIENVFVPFKKTSVKTTGNESSTGLGLYISKNIIESHLGKIGVTSKVGKGSTFFYELPYSNEANMMFDDTAA